MACRGLCFSPHFTTSTALLLAVIMTSSASASLYNESMSVKVLNSSNFYDTLIEKENAWVVQFYNSWCGHCIRYAPVFSAFAKDIAGWKRVIAVAAIDCSDLRNLRVCRDFNVNSYPTVKLLRAGASRSDRGLDGEPLRTLEALRRQAIDFVQGGNASNVPGVYPPNWPSLLPTSVDRLAELWDHVPEVVQRIILVLENEHSYLGREVTLDFSGSNTTRVFRVLPSNRDLQAELAALEPLGEYATLYVMRRGVQHPRLLAKVSTATGARQQFRNALKELHAAASTTMAVTTSLAPLLADSAKVYQVDLENAVSYALRQEVPVHAMLNSTQLEAVKHFVAVLVDFFPGSPAMMQFLRQLQDYLEPLQVQLRGEDLSNFIASFTGEEAALPEVKEYVGCRGSRPNLRGYPCSLWMLFHTLTVNAYTAYREGRAQRPLEVLQVIRGYVGHFFSCRECALNFAREAHEMEQEAQRPQDTVLWLWALHNQVNVRLAGDRTEDPEHPKVPFPPTSLCPECRKEGRWDVQPTLRFLLSFYGRGNLVRRGAEVVARGVSRATSRHGTWHQLGALSRTDVGLCVVLYAASLLLLVLVYFVFVARWRKHRFQRNILWGIS